MIVTEYNGTLICMVSKAQRRANDRYDKANTTQIKMKLNNKTDADILEHLNKQKNKQGYIKDLIRRDMSKNG